MLKKESRLRMEKVKMIWDFRGPNALKTAEHHEKHLKEYIVLNNLKVELTGFEALSGVHAVAFIVVEESEVNALPVALKPHRGMIYKP